MWFKNLQIYRYKDPVELSAEALESALADQVFRPCGALEASSLGWSPPLGRDADPLVHAANGFLMFCARREDKLLPAAVVKETLAERVDDLQRERGEALRRREKEALREQIRDNLLPRALSQHRRYYAYIDPLDGWLLVDAASAARAEDLCSLLRESLGSLPVSPLESAQRPAAVLTRWLQTGRAEAGFALADECDLQSPAREGSVVRCRRQDLTAREVLGHLQAGKEVTRLALQWRERIGLVLSEDLELRRLRFLDLIQDQAREVHADTEIERFDADFSIMSLELRALLQDLVGAFGGAKAGPSPAAGRVSPVPRAR